MTFAVEVLRCAQDDNVVCNCAIPLRASPDRDDRAPAGLTLLFPEHYPQRLMWSDGEMTETRTLQFENARAVQSLYANDLKLLKNLEESLGVKVTTREGWIKVEGEPAQVEKAEQVFSQLENARQRGVEIQRHEFNYALNSVNEAREDNLGDLVTTKIITSSRKPPIVARTLGQRHYLEAIQKNDVVFGIGPAGTGKTYLAVAMAVSALKKEQVDRIILTRPAVEAGEALGFLPGDLQQKITPYLRPLYDALHDMLEPEELERYVARETIEIAPLAYMRGRTLSNAFVILDEAQNTTTRANVHAPHSHWPALEMCRDRRRHADRSPAEQTFRSARGAPGVEGCARNRLRLFQRPRCR